MGKLLYKKVWTVNAEDVEWVECKHVNKMGQISQLESYMSNLECQLDFPDNNRWTKK